MKSFQLTVFLLLPMIAPCQILTSSVQIVGHVFSRYGTPVGDARVVFWSYSGGSGPQPVTTTSKDGYFSLTLSNLGAGAVSASKIGEGYPDAALAFYGRSGYESLKVVDPKKDSFGTLLGLYFGTPQRTISWSVVDGSTGNPLSGARAYLEAVENPVITGSETILRGEPFVFVVPRSPVKIRISAVGYVDKSFVEQDQAVTSPNGAHFTIEQGTIRLQRVR
jgi:hypothetical protein